MKILIVVLALLAISAKAAGQCTASQWVQYPNMNDASDAGSVRAAFTTQATCQAGCEADIDCVAYHFVTTQTFLNCFFHADNTANNIVASTGIDFYQLQTVCTHTDGSQCTFINVGQYTFMSDLIAAATSITESACKLDCLSQSSCVSASFLTGGTTSSDCLLSADTNNYLNGRTRENGRQQYIKANCTAATAEQCTDTQWVEYVDKTNADSSGVEVQGQVQAGFTTQATCQAGCEADVDCTAFSFLTTQTFLNCYFHSDNTANTQTASVGSNFYQREAVCTLSDGSQCRFVYVGQYTFTSDLIAAPTSTSGDACGLDCMIQSTCLSGTFLSGGTPECILSADTNNYLNGRTRENGRQQYIKANCTAAARPPSPCDAMPQSLRLRLYNYTTEAACLRAGYCWNNDSKFCYTEKATTDCDITLSDRVKCGPPHAPQTQLSQNVCERDGCCWDPTILTEMHCYTKKLTDPCDFPNRIRCDSRMENGQLVSVIDPGLCRRFKCCWDEEEKRGLQCYQRNLPDPCDYEKRVNCWNTAHRVMAQRNLTIQNRSDCVEKYNCCWDTRQRWCYRKDGCYNWAHTYGPCTKTCGIGIRSRYDGCGFFVAEEKCCIMPCPKPTGSPVRTTRAPIPHIKDACKNYKPFGG